MKSLRTSCQLFLYHIRKFYINDKGKFNQPIENFFVLGGLCLDEKQKDNVESLMSNLKLQKNVKELKAHHVLAVWTFQRIITERGKNSSSPLNETAINMMFTF